jgi:hypothetical protein
MHNGWLPVAVALMSPRLTTSMRLLASCVEAEMPKVFCVLDDAVNSPLLWR